MRKKKPYAGPGYYLYHTARFWGCNENIYVLSASSDSTFWASEVWRKRRKPPRAFLSTRRGIIGIERIDTVERDRLNPWVWRAWRRLEGDGCMTAKDKSENLVLSNDRIVLLYQMMAGRRVLDTYGKAYPDSENEIRHGYVSKLFSRTAFVLHIAAGSVLLPLSVGLLANGHHTAAGLSGLIVANIGALGLVSKSLLKSAQNAAIGLNRILAPMLDRHLHDMGIGAMRSASRYSLRYFVRWVFDTEELKPYRFNIAVARQIYDGLRWTGIKATFGVLAMLASHWFLMHHAGINVKNAVPVGEGWLLALIMLGLGTAMAGLCFGVIGCMAGLMWRSASIGVSVCDHALKGKTETLMVSLDPPAWYGCKDDRE